MAVIDRPRQKARRAAANPGLELLERLGYCIRGLLYAGMGFLALGVAVGKPGARTTDLNGTLLFVSGNPLRGALLVVVIAGLGAYALWGVVRAVLDPLHRGSDASGYMERLGFLSSAISYSALALFAIQVLAGGASGGDSVQKAIAQILAHPAGGWITAGIGLFAMGVGGGQFVQAYRGLFKRDLKRSEMSKAEHDVAVALGRFGICARGLTFLVMGWLLFEAGTQHDVTKARGYAGVMVFLLDRPFGHLLLAAVALGFIALGMHSLACARWVRLMGSSR